MTRVALVVPTCRADRFGEFRRLWASAPWHDVVVVCDQPRGDFRVEWPGAAVYFWEDYEELYGHDGWIFSRRDSACRCFGFLQAVRRGADFVVTLDDDCHPADPAEAACFPGAHVKSLEQPPRWTSTVAGLHVRGMPYGGEGVIDDAPPVLVHMGLWRGVPDLSAVQALALRSAAQRRTAAILSDFGAPPGTRVMSPHQLFPFCGMNFSFRREALPALYFPPMGEGCAYARFDDIWGGLLLQRICARTGHLLTVGEPEVQHTGASNAFENLGKEAPGIAAHEHYWQTLVRLPIVGSTLAGCVLSASEALEGQEDPYLARWGQALRVWVSLCEKALQEPAEPESDSATIRGLRGRSRDQA